MPLRTGDGQGNLVPNYTLLVEMETLSRHPPQHFDRQRGSFLLFETQDTSQDFDWLPGRMASLRSGGEQRTFVGLEAPSSLRGDVPRPLKLNPT